MQLRLAIDNNAVERGIRPIGVGRRNWLFAGSDAGGETLARAMTIIETAKPNGLDPQAHLADILDRVSTITWQTVSTNSCAGTGPLTKNKRSKTQPPEIARRFK